MEHKRHSESGWILREIHLIQFASHSRWEKWIFDITHYSICVNKGGEEGICRHCLSFEVIHPLCRATYEEGGCGWGP